MNRNSKTRWHPNPQAALYLFLSLTLAASLLLPSPANALPGVTLQEIGKGSALTRAGLAAGDTVIAWERLPAKGANSQGARGSFLSPFDWLQVETEQASRGLLVIQYERGGQCQQATVLPGPWFSKVGPQLPKERVPRYSEAEAASSRRDYRTAVLIFEDVASSVDEEEAHDSLAWIHLRIAQNRRDARDFHRAISDLESAMPATRDSYALAVLWDTLASVHAQAGDLAQAKWAYLEALTLKESLPEADLVVAKALNSLCGVVRRQGRLDEAQTLCRRSLDMRSRVAPGSLEEAAGFNALGSVLLSFGDKRGSSELFQRALAIHELLAPETLLHADTLSNTGVASANKELRLTNLKHALEIYDRLEPESLSTADILSNIGVLFRERGNLIEAQRFYNRALALQQKLAPNSLAVASTLRNLGVLYRERNELRLAESFHLQALVILERLTPGSLENGNSLLNLGLVADNRGDLDAAESYYRRALELQERNAPGSMNVAVTLNNLGLLMYMRGDLRQSEEYHLRSLRIREHLDPERAADSLNNLGLVALQRGDADLAYEYFRKSLAMKESVGSLPASLAVTLTNLGLAAWYRLDLTSALKYLKRALELRESSARGTLDEALILTTLGAATSESGDIAGARQYLLRALQVAEGVSHDSFELGRIFQDLGDLEWSQGKRTRAKYYWKKALSIARRRAPQSMYEADTLDNLAEAMIAESDLKTALRLQTEALAIRKGISPGSLGEAVSEFSVAGMLRRMGKSELAERHAENAVVSLERQIVRLGGPRELQEKFGTRYHYFYRQWIELLLERGLIAEAFHVLERSRARSFLAMLQERDLGFLDAPETESERKRLAIEYDKVQQELANLQPRKDLPKIAEIQERLGVIRERYDAALAELRKTSPGLAALEVTEALDAERTKRTLAPGTILLSFSLGKQTSNVFVLSLDAEPEVAGIPVGEDQLRDMIEKFRSLIHETSKSGIGTLRTEALQTLGRRLFELLLEPVANRISHSARVLIIPDGPLHFLPWGALIQDIEQTPNSDRSWIFVSEWKPLHTALSATVYAGLVTYQGAQAIGLAPLAAFGDPVYPAPIALNTNSVDTRIRSAVERGFEFTPLPFTRTEVEEIANLYRDASVQTYLGLDASEEHVKALQRNTPIVHLAAHGYINEHQPLDSAVVLTVPETLIEGRENGLLQAWEIFENLRLDTELVVLSACESGLGKEMGGEGLIGLTRAFQYAGARSVMASLWNISDRTTAEFMVRFYRHLKDGLSKDEALRATQMEFIRGPIQVTNDKGERVDFDASAPYYWAAFQIYGDWQ